MSKSVLELAVETGQWTGGLKKAQSALQNFTQASGSTSDAISKSGDKMAQFVSRMGNMESKAKTATGRLKEMENVYKELAVQYKQLTDQERQTPYGKALNQSLSQLQTRIKSARVDIQSVNAELGTGSNGMGDAMQQLAGKMGLPIASLSKLSVGLAAASAAAKVLKDAFMQSETKADEWGSALEEARGSYNTFLATINGGNWTSFFTNLREAITGAKELYEALDRLDTVKGVNAAAIAIEQKTIQELRKQAKEGKDVTAELEKHTATLLDLQNQSVVAGKDAGQKTMREAITNTMNARTGEHATAQDVTSAIDRLIKEGVSALDDFTKENSDLKRKGMEEKYMRGADGVMRLTGYEFNIEKLSKEEQARYNLTKAIIESEAEWRKGISTYASAVGEGASAIKENIKADSYGSQKGGGTGSGKTGGGNEKTYAEGSIAAQEAEVKRLQEAFNGASVEMQGGYLRALDAAKLKLQEMKDLAQQLSQTLSFSMDPKSTADIMTEAVDKMNQSLAETKERLNKAGKTSVKAADDTEGAWQMAAGAVSTVGSALSGLENPGASVAALIAQAIANVALGAGKAISAKDSTASGYAWIGLAATAAAEMVGIISTIKSATEYHAEGGIVGMQGLKKGTDIIPAMLTPGEEVLMASDPRHRNNLARSMQSGYGHGYQGVPYTNGEMIMLGINNYLRRTGQGELVTTKTMRR